MTDLTPDETFRAAAERLRERAALATPGPWRIGDTHLGQHGHTATVLTDRENLNDTDLVAWLPSMSQTPWDGTRMVWGTSDWIALMHPGVGLALAAWLDAAAKSYDASVTAAERVWGPEPSAVREQWVVDRTDRHALATARAVLGEVTE